MQISVRSNTDEIVRQMRAFGSREIPFATARALTWTAKDAQAAEVEELPKVFDKPTRYTLRSIYIVPATKAKLSARVWIKDERAQGNGGLPAAKYLEPEIKGGPRGHKSFEKRLIRQGLMPSDMYAVPGARVPLDAFGNVRGSLIEKILSVLGAAEQFAGVTANQTAGTRAKAIRRGRHKDYFVGRPGNGSGPLGVWERIKGGGARPILIFVRSPNYKPRFDFYGVANRTADRRFPINMRRSLAEALASGKAGNRPGGP